MALARLRDARFCLESDSQTQRRIARFKMTTAILPQSNGADSSASRETANDPMADLESQRNEARRKILSLKSRTPFARLFNGLGRAFELNSPGYWLSNVALLNLILLGPAALIALATNVCPISVALFVAGFSAPIRQYAGVGFTLASILAGLLAGVLYYAAAWAFRVVASLKDYHYEMNAVAPADSQILSDVSDMVTRSIFILAAYFGSVTLLFGSSLVEPELRNVLAFPILVIGWAFIAAQFLLTRATLGAITNRSKWATLNRIRIRVNLLEATGDLSEKDTADRLLRLSGIHKEVMASKTNTLDLKTFATLTSQLMLPLLGLLLGNLDKIVALLRK